ncbi:hypothetical protein KIW84_054643 [Lathyrus oleraceus]|uniref:Uncharacterized protein n=1 Tax=Pisum sativum TaxID=3888 RepID=A0A9D4WYF4_PEA|nr:hypothetical protein KIW84_054643 [Pisum sativum]
MRGPMRQNTVGCIPSLAGLRPHHERAYGWLKRKIGSQEVIKRPTLQTKGRSFPGNLATLRFPVTGRIGPVTFVTVGSRNQAKPFDYVFLKGLRFITPKAFSELFKLSREYQMLTKVTDFRWTRSQRVFK